MKKSKKKIGRPTDYSEEILAKTQEYLETYSEQGDAIPSVAGLAVYLRIARSTIYDWASQPEKKLFSDILEDILSDQEKTLINKGLKGEFNSTITKLALGKHGYKEQSETDLTSKGEKIVFMPQELITKHDTAQSTKPDSAGKE